MKTVMVFGTFDFFHIGHLHFLMQAKSLGDKLIVVVAPDTIVEKLKGKLPLHNQEERMNLVYHIDVVDEVIVGDNFLGEYSGLQEHKPNIVAIGYDQNDFFEDVKTFIEEKQLPVQLVQLNQYTEKEIKSSHIKATLPI